ncbi:MAG TPA: Fic family protein [Solirubrobacterales bacterium]|nr:Fic family protein [Solirubrobacterales bacterium]
MTVAAPAASRAGRFRQAQDGSASYVEFFPAPLPPKPSLQLDVELHRLLDQANQALGRLDGITMLLPDPSQFLYTFIRKEAVLSSQIEGTMSSLSDLLLFENEVSPGAPVEDIEEAVNYIAALNHGVNSIESGQLPLCNRLLREVHARLLRSGRGSEKSPGEFRRSQNWLGGTRPGNARYVPPPWEEVEPAMSALERFLHDDPSPSPVLIKAALAHVQFETIHPFLDGNGRVGRLLITLLLIEQGVLQRPLLYLSLYLKRNRDAYYEHLQRVRMEGAWEDWLRFFLEGVIDVAGSTANTTRGIVAMIERDRGRIHGFGRGAATALRVHDLAVRRVVVKAPTAATQLSLSEPPVYAAISRLEQAGILREVTGRARGKTYVYGEYMDILNEGTEL